MKTVLTIAGSDCSGGAGIQADIKTMIMNGVYAMSAITALTAQNTTGVYGIQETSPEFLDNQLDCIFTDIFPDAVKMIRSCIFFRMFAGMQFLSEQKNIQGPEGKEDYTGTPGRTFFSIAGAGGK